MTLAKARELLAVQASMGGGYNRNAAKLILAEVQAEHGQASVDALIREFDLAVIDRGVAETGVDEALRPEVAGRMVEIGDDARQLDRLQVGRGGRIFRLPTAPIPISSSTVRARARAGRDLDRLVPPAVARYIHDMGLYRQEEDH